MFIKNDETCDYATNELISWTAPTQDRSVVWDDGRTHGGIGTSSMGDNDKDFISQFFSLLDVNAGELHPDVVAYYNAEGAETADADTPDVVISMLCPSTTDFFTWTQGTIDTIDD
jgi:hypothetical protein